MLSYMQLERLIRSHTQFKYASAANHGLLGHFLGCTRKSNDKSLLVSIVMQVLIQIYCRPITAISVPSRNSRVQGTPSERLSGILGGVELITRPLFTILGNG